MTVYFDPPRHYPSGNWSHLVADTDEELHAAAAAAGIPRHHCQSSRRHRHPHYDVHPKHLPALRAFGAVELSSKELLRHLK